VEFLVAVFYFARGGDPYQSILDLFSIVGRFVDADGDGEAVFLGGFAQALDELGVVDGFAEFETAGGG